MYYLLGQDPSKVGLHAVGNSSFSTLTISALKSRLDVVKKNEWDSSTKLFVCHTDVHHAIGHYIVKVMPEK